MRTVSLIASVLGLLLCLAAAGTGIWYGVVKTPEAKAIHLPLAVSCVLVSLPAHAIAFKMVKKTAKT